MYAIIETGGKQYKVQYGDVIFVEKLAAEEEATVEFPVNAVCGDDGDMKVVGDTYLFGVDEIDGDAGFCIAYESGSGIYSERRTDDDKHVGLHNSLSGNGNHRHSFAKEDDERAEQRTVASLLSWSHFIVVGSQLDMIAGVVWIVARTSLHQFAMKMNDL